MQAYFSEKNQLGHNLQRYMCIHAPGTDSLCSLPSLFPTSRPLCGRLPTESEQKYLSHKLISQQQKIFLYYLPIILKLQYLTPPFWATLRQMPKGLPEGLPMGRMQMTLANCIPSFRGIPRNSQEFLGILKNSQLCKLTLI